MSQSAIVVDLYLAGYPNYFHVENVSVKYLVVSSEEIRTRVTSEYPDVCVYLESDVCFWDSTYVSVTDILDYLPAQLKVYRGSVRDMNKKIYDSKIESMYYSSLAFWIYHFQGGVDLFMLFQSAEHGNFFDSVPLAVSKKMGIPAISTDLTLVGKSGYWFFAVKEHVTGRYIDLTEVCNWEQIVDFHDLIFHTVSNEKLPDSPKALEYPKWFRKLYYHCVNSKLSLVAFFSGKLAGTTRDSIGGVPFEIRYSDYLRFKSYMRSLKRNYLKHSVSELNPNTNAIIYAMHFEPEASIMNRTIYNSQLYNIRMLAASLPKDWILYVKEHPDTFRVSIKNAYFMLTMSNYRNKQYYSDILSIPNVRLLGIDMSSHYLLNHPQVKAISTINGTISVEAMESKKPVLLFDSSSIPYMNIDDLFFISSIEDLKDAMSKLESGFQPTYNQYTMLISRYLCISKYDTKGIDLSPTCLSKVIEYVISLSNKNNGCDS